MFKKIAFGVFLALIGIAAGAGYWAYTKGEKTLEKYIKVQLEKGTSQALGVNVSLSSFDISIDERKVTFSDFQIANPKGFEKPYVFKAKGISIKLGDVSRDLVIVKDIDISGIQVNYTARAGGSNLIRLRENLEKYRAGQVKRKGKARKAPKVIVERFHFQGARITPEMKLIAGQSLDTKINLSEIYLENIGAEENGVQLSAAFENIMRRFNSRVRTAVARAGLFEGLTQVGPMGITGGIPIIGVADEILGLVGLGDDDDSNNYGQVKREPKTLDETLNN